MSYLEVSDSNLVTNLTTFGSAKGLATVGTCTSDSSSLLEACLLELPLLVYLGGVFEVADLNSSSSVRLLSLNTESERESF